MCVDGSYHLRIPPHFGYGEKGVPDYIPGSAVLLVSVTPKRVWEPMDERQVAECEDSTPSFKICDAVRLILRDRCVIFFIFSLEWRWICWLSRIFGLFFDMSDPRRANEAARRRSDGRLPTTRRRRQLHLDRRRIFDGFSRGGSRRTLTTFRLSLAF